MVQAPVRLCAAALRRTADRTCRASRRRSRAIEEFRVRTFDTFQVIDPRVKTAKPVRIVNIDERSLAKFGQWPWPRTRVADLVTNLTRLGAVAIAFDIMFAEPDRLNPAAAAETLRNLDDETRTKLRALPSNDDILADAMRQSRVVLGETGLPYVVAELDKELPVTGLAMLGEDPQRFMLKFPGLLRSTPVLEAAASGRGLLTIRTERDGIVRRVPVIMQAQGVTMPSLSFEMLRVATGSDTIFIKSTDAGIASVAVKGFAVPTDRNGQLWVHFAPLRSIDLCLGGRCARRKGRPGHHCRQAGADRDIGRRPARRQDHADFSGHARRRNPCPGAGSRADRGAAVAAAVGASRRISFGDDPWPRGDLVCSDVRAEIARRRRRLLRNVAGGNVLVLLFAAPAPDRSHLSVAVDHRDLPDPDLFRASRASRRSGGRSARRSASICRRRWSSSSRRRRRDWCSAARSAR